MNYQPQPMQFPSLLSKVPSIGLQDWCADNSYKALHSYASLKHNSRGRNVKKHNKQIWHNTDIMLKHLSTSCCSLLKPWFPAVQQDPVPTTNSVSITIPNGKKKKKHGFKNQVDHSGVEEDKSLSLCGHYAISDGSYNWRSLARSRIEIAKWKAFT